MREWGVLNLDQDALTHYRAERTGIGLAPYRTGDRSGSRRRSTKDEAPLPVSKVASRIPVSCGVVLPPFLGSWFRSLVDFRCRSFDGRSHSARQGMEWGPNLRTAGPWMIPGAFLISGVCFHYRITEVSPNMTAKRKIAWSMVRPSLG